MFTSQIGAIRGTGRIMGAADAGLPANFGGTEALDLVLGSEDLLGIVFRHAEESSAAARAWCCPQRSSSSSSSSSSAIGGTSRQASLPRVTLARALRMRRVSKVWQSVIDAQLRDARSIDFRGVTPSSSLTVHGMVRPLLSSALSLVTELLVDDVAFIAGDLSNVLGACPPSLTALSLKRCDRSDDEIAQAIGLLRCGPHLRSLSLAESIQCGGATAAALRRLAPRALTALDVSGCRHISHAGPMRLEALFSACPRLARLDLSRHTGLTSAVIGSILLSLSASLTHLSVDGCGLTDETLTLASDDGAGATGSALGGAGGPSTATMWSRMTRLRELYLADNPRISGGGVCAILGTVPSLCALDIGSSDFWPSEVSALLSAVRAAPNLRWLGCQDCGPWLTPKALARIQSPGRGVGVRVACAPDLIRAASAATPAAAVDLSRRRRQEAAAAAAPLVDSWEEALEIALTIDDHGTSSDGGVDFDGDSEAAGAAPVPAASASARQPSSTFDYGRPRVAPGIQPSYGSTTAHGTAWRSIYHVSTGDQPLYGDGTAVATRSQTDSHGLRT